MYERGVFDYPRRVLAALRTYLAATLRRQHDVMRFQIQWSEGSTKRNFSAVASAPLGTGVRVRLAVDALHHAHALVQPRAARAAADDAVARAERWIRQRPPEGVSAVGNVHREFFSYGKYRARVDVENLCGHNLRG